MKRAGLLLAFGLLAAANAAFAIAPNEMLSNPRLEARARTISKELRCLVCQNESIDESDAPLAHDLRVIVRKRLLAGDSDAQVKQYIVARYGTFVLMKPPFEAETLLLWLGPALVLAGAGAAAFFFYRSRSAESLVPPPLSDDEKIRLAALTPPTETPR
ncbi:MAG: cytochrome c-type biogenesis protein CcmH [Alphaproteobacteria bacterium]|nr:cytochrome c-type biogenesis protein CcmH [Alphaproteobacteria bacterium]